MMSQTRVLSRCSKLVFLTKAEEIICTKPFLNDFPVSSFCFSVTRHSCGHLHSLPPAHCTDGPIRASPACPLTAAPSPAPSLFLSVHRISTEGHSLPPNTHAYVLSCVFIYNTHISGREPCFIIIY